MNANHTAGPWRVNEFDGRAEVLDASGKNACVKQNAPLIAAAPDLLDELYRALPFLEDMRDDPGYKNGAVVSRIKSINALIKGLL